MFKQRLITALALISLVLIALYYANFTGFASVIMCLVMGCGLEWLQLIPVKSWWVKIIFLMLLLINTWLVNFISGYWLISGLMAWGGIFLAVLWFPRSQLIWGRQEIVSLLALLLLPLFAQSLMDIYHLPAGKALIIYLLSLVWAADIGAYLVGKLWGRHQLIGAVSPGKTFEGLLGGLLSSLFIASVAYFYFLPSSALSWLVMASVIMLISLLGDLFISMLKRRVQMKDTGKLLPGHGGILDRLDSLIAAAPIFYLGVTWLSSGIIKWS